MTKAFERYGEVVQNLIQTIMKTQEPNFRQAGQTIAEAIKNDKLIHVIGPGGHSYIGAEEMFFRCGGLVPVNAIFDPGVSLSFGGTRSMAVERLPGYAAAVLSCYEISRGDVMIVVNAYGINSCTIDSAIEGKRRGAKVIAITSPAFAKATPSDHPARHPSRKNLFELDEVDVVIDNNMPVGDDLIEFESLGETKVGASSTIVNAFCINCMVLTAVECLLEMGIEPPVWRSGNMPGGDEYNQQYIAKYKNRLRHL